MTPEIALMETLQGLLLDADGVTDIVGEGVYDEVPDDQQPGNAPYVYLGPINRTRIETGCGVAWTLRARLYAISTKFNRTEAWQLGDAVARALEGAEPPVQSDSDSSYRFQDQLRVVQAGDVVEPPSPKAVFVDVTTVISQSA